MNFDSQLNLQAYLDGELSPREARRVEFWLAEDQQARLLMAELQNTRAALSGHESETKLPETREFYWRKIENEIQRQSQTRLEPGAPSIFFSWRKFLIPAAAITALLVLAVIVGIPYRLSSSNLARNIARHFHEYESPSEDTRGFTFRDQATGTTVVWITYADDEVFTDTGLIDNIQ